MCPGKLTDIIGFAAKNKCTASCRNGSTRHVVCRWSSLRKYLERRRWWIFRMAGCYVWTRTCVVFRNGPPSTRGLYVGLLWGVWRSRCLSATPWAAHAMAGERGIQSRNRRESWSRHCLVDVGMFAIISALFGKYGGSSLEWLIAFCIPAVLLCHEDGVSFTLRLVRCCGTDYSRTSYIMCWGCFRKLFSNKCFTT